MAKVRLTTRFIDSIKIDVRTDYHDTLVQGLSLRISPSGTKTWNLLYTRESDGTKQRVKLGRYPAIDLETARSKALKAMGGVSEGKDPASDKRARRDAMTVQEVGELYLEKHAKRNKKTWKQDEQLLKSEVYPEIGRMKALAVKKRDLLDIIEAKAEEGKGAQSNNLLAVIRKMFNWAVDNDYLEASPASGIKPRAKPVRRDRVLSIAEIKEIWAALPDAALSPHTVRIIKLLFMTGQRSGEVCGILRGEIDLENATWTIPANRVKNGLTHVVPLSKPAIAILEEAIAATDPEADNPPLFSRVEDPIESNAVAKAVRLKLQVTKERWTPHDIRRTVATGMADIGTLPHVIEACLNHISGFKAGVAGVYNRATYEPEKRKALDNWADYLTRNILEH
ncbi:integrase [Brucella endophytica]|uniref:Integrase n=1 Tax=Brucella endophytica TaxID=1963359 RepID=A0A916S502_9HYPH|nr:site-specific integrase [Brucella endophytica]GGA81314.1 integrase [Brucella endophytica]